MTEHRARGWACPTECRASTPLDHASRVPQALKLSAASWIDAFVRLERIDQPDAGGDGRDSGGALRRRAGVDLSSVQSAPPAHATGTTAHSPCSFNLSGLEPLMCRFYAADFACLPHEKPAACRDAERTLGDR